MYRYSAAAKRQFKGSSIAPKRAQANKSVTFSRRICPKRASGVMLLAVAGVLTVPTIQLGLETGRSHLNSCKTKMKRVVKYCTTIYTMPDPVLYYQFGCTKL